MLLIFGVISLFSNNTVGMAISSFFAYTTPESLEALTDFGIILGTIISLSLIAGFLEKRQKTSFNNMMELNSVTSEKKIAEETARLIAKDLAAELAPIRGSIEDTEHRLSRLENSFDAFLLNDNYQKSRDDR